MQFESKRSQNEKNQWAFLFAYHKLLFYGDLSKISIISSALNFDCMMEL